MLCIIKKYNIFLHNFIFNDNINNNNILKIFNFKKKTFY